MVRFFIEVSETFSHNIPSFSLKKSKFDILLSTSVSKQIKEIGNFCAAKLNAVNIRVHAPQGGFYIFPDFYLIIIITQ